MSQRELSQSEKILLEKLQANISLFESNPDLIFPVRLLPEKCGKNYLPGIVLSINECSGFPLEEKIIKETFWIKIAGILDNFFNPPLHSNCAHFLDKKTFYNEIYSPNYSMFGDDHLRTHNRFYEEGRCRFDLDKITISGSGICTNNLFKRSQGVI